MQHLPVTLLCTHEQINMLPHTSRPYRPQKGVMLLRVQGCRKSTQMEDFYGNKCRWKCGRLMISQMPRYLGSCELAPDALPMMPAPYRVTESRAAFTLAADKLTDLLFVKLAYRV